jgi:hypothetical protein
MNKTVISCCRRFLVFALVCAAAGCASTGTRSGPAAEVPARFKPLYSELDRELAGAEKTARALPDAGRACPVMAPSLYIASSYFGPAAPGTARWKDIMSALDGFQALGANAVSLMISFPDLTSENKDPAPLLKFYAALAAEVRARKMKLLVEHFVYPPSAPTRAGRFVAGLKTLPDPKEAFLNMQRTEIELILSRIKPDYLSVVSEPETLDRFLGFSIPADEYAQWLGALADDVAGSGVKGSARLGAGAGAWESGLYVPAFAKVKGLDYIDIHFYPLALGGENMFARFLDLADKVRAEDPSKEIVVSEAWLYKHGAAEPKGVFNTEAYGRDAYDFWAPLDARFLRLMASAGRKKGVSVIAPYFPQFFFTSGKYGPAAQPAWPAVMTAEWQSAIEAARSGQVSATGAAFRDIIGGCK